MSTATLPTASSKKTLDLVPRAKAWQKQIQKKRLKLPSISVPS